MKKLFLLSMLMLALVSCQNDVEFNNPSFEAKKDGVFWRAVDARAALTNDGLVIQAFSSKEVVTLTTISATPQTYPLGTSAPNIASYELTDGKGSIIYSTGDDIGEGEIVIEEFDAVNKTVTGTFKFNAENIEDNPIGGPVLNYQYGTFYKIPVTINLTSPVTNPATQTN